MGAPFLALMTWSATSWLRVCANQQKNEPGELDKAVSQQGLCGSVSNHLDVSNLFTRLRKNVFTCCRYSGNICITKFSSTCNHLHCNSKPKHLDPQPTEC